MLRVMATLVKQLLAGENDLLVEPVRELAQLTEADGWPAVWIRSEVDREEQVRDHGAEQLTVEPDDGSAHEMPGDERVLDELEEGLHGPSVLVEVGDLEGGEIVVAGEVLEDASVISSVDDEAKAQRAAVEPHYFVAKHALALLVGGNVEDPIDFDLHLALQASDELCLSTLDCAKEIEADVAAIEDVGSAT